MTARESSTTTCTVCMAGRTPSPPMSESHFFSVRLEVTEERLKCLHDSKQKQSDCLQSSAFYTLFSCRTSGLIRQTALGSTAHKKSHSESLSSSSTTRTSRWATLKVLTQSRKKKQSEYSLHAVTLLSITTDTRSSRCFHVKLSEPPAEQKSTFFTLEYSPQKNK